LLAASAALLVVGAMSWADDLSQMPHPTKPPRVVHLEAVLAPALAARANGHAVYDGYMSGGPYSLSAELVVPSRDFKEFGIDPSNGFDDEKVLLTVHKKGIDLVLTFSHTEMDGVVFQGAVKDVSPEAVLKGDALQVSVNGNDAAQGKF